MKPFQHVRYLKGRYRGIIEARVEVQMCFHQMYIQSPGNPFHSRDFHKLDMSCEEALSDIVRNLSKVKTNR